MSTEAKAPTETPSPTTRRTARGSLRRHLELEDEWDSVATNESIAHDFGLSRDGSDSAHERG